MRYVFPEIRTLDDVLPAIKDRTEVGVLERDDYLYIDYHVNLIDTFPDLDTAPDEETRRLLAIRRECRGLKFYKNGKLAGRPYHKFFNLGERPETQQHGIDWSKPFSIPFKLDGSMIHPIRIQGQIALCTRAGTTDVAGQAQAWAEQYRHYLNFCNIFVNNEMTPIFEWCSRKQRIVVDHPEDRLVLTGIRDNLTGKYMLPKPMEALAYNHGIECNGYWNGDFGDIGTFLAMAKARTGEEGFVIRFDDGHMLKVKNDWYCQIHSTKEAMSLEKNVVAMCLGQAMDDLLPRLLPDDKYRLLAFNDDLFRGIDVTAAILKEEVDLLKRLGVLRGDNTKKFFALAIKDREDPYRGLLFSIYDGRDPRKAVQDLIAKNTATGTKVDSVRKLFGDINWYDYSPKVELDA